MIARADHAIQHPVRSVPPAELRRIPAAFVSYASAAGTVAIVVTAILLPRIPRIHTKMDGIRGQVFSVLRAKFLGINSNKDWGGSLPSFLSSRNITMEESYPGTIPLRELAGGR
jgi:hypothetical protein